MNKDALAIRDNILKAAPILKKRLTTREYNLLMEYAREFNVLSDNTGDTRSVAPEFKDDMQAGYLLTENMEFEKDIKGLFKIISTAESKLARDLRNHSYQPKIIEYKPKTKTYKRKAD